MVRTHAIDPTFFFTLRTRWFFNNHVAIEPDFGYFHSDKADVTCASGTCTNLGLRDTNLGASVIAYSATWSDVALYFGGGAAAHMRKGDVSANLEKSETRLGFQALFGADFRISDKVGIDAAIRADYVTRGDLEAQHQLKIFGGLRIDL